MKSALIRLNSWTVISLALFALFVFAKTANAASWHDALAIPASLSFKAVGSLSHEMVERLERVRPNSFGDARKIPGLTPAALSNLLVFLTAQQTKTLNA